MRPLLNGGTLGGPMGRAKRQPVRRNVVAVERYSTAAAFLDALHPRHRHWRPLPEHWIFRGHARASWSLLPAAFREESVAPFDGIPTIRIAEGARTAWERLVLREFGESLDAVGLALPGMTRQQLGQLKAESSVSPQWIRECIELAALAQHHGVPTRLLDFTQHAFVAAYFAALPPASHPGRDLCVWALDRSFLDHGNRCNGVWFSELRASRATNPNLHAQAGSFVVWTGLARIVPLDGLLRSVVSGRFRLSSGSLMGRFPIMRKLILPRREAPRLLELLVDERVTGATLFPGVDGVVREMKERLLYKRWPSRL